MATKQQQRPDKARKDWQRQSGPPRTKLPENQLPASEHYKRL